MYFFNINNRLHWEKLGVHNNLQRLLVSFFPPPPPPPVLRHCLFLSPTAAALHHHVLVVFQNHLLVLVQVEEGDGAELRGHAARPRDVGVDRVDQRLHDGVVGGVHVSVEGEGALAIAVVGGVALGGNDPVLGQTRL